MAYCDLNYTGQEVNYNSSVTEGRNVSNTFVWRGEPLNLIAEKDKVNSADIILVTSTQEYNLNSPVSINETVSFYIKVIFNGSSESFFVNLINTDCNTSLCSLKLNYEV